MVAELSDGTHCGRGEAAGVYYLGDDVPAMLAAVERVRPVIEAGATRSDLQSLLPPGGARNAIDCAWWELEAKQSRRPVWEIAGVPEPRPHRTTLTLGADDPIPLDPAATAPAHVPPLTVNITRRTTPDATPHPPAP